MGISERIKAIREKKRIKQVDLADSLNLAPSYYSRLEKRGEKMTIEQLQSIADALQVSLGEVLGIKSNPVGTEKVKVLEIEIEDLKRINEGYRVLHTEYTNKLQYLHMELVGNVQRNMIQTAIDKGILTKERTKGWLVSDDLVFEKPYMIDFDVDTIEAKGLDPNGFFLSSLLTEQEIYECLLDQNESTMNFLTTLAMNKLIEDKVLERAFWKYQRNKHFPGGKK